MTITPPIAARIEHPEVRHGETVVDPYHWLREKSNQEVIRYLEAENAYTAAMTSELQPFTDQVYAEMLGRIQQTDLSVPARRGRYFYYVRTEEGKQYPIRCRRAGSMDAPEEVLLDLNELALGHAFLGLGAFRVSDDDTLLAYTTDTTGFRQYTLHVKDLRTGQLLPDTLERVTCVEWAADGKTLFLVTEDESTKRSDRFWRFTLGDASPVEIYNEADELFHIGCDRTRDRQYVMLLSRSTDTSEVRYGKASEPLGEFRVLLPREDKHRYSVDHRDGLFYIRSNKDAKNFRLMTAPVTDPSPANWKVFVDHQPDVLNEGIDLFRDFAVIIEKAEALERLRVYLFDAATFASIPFSEPIYTARPDMNPEFDTGVFRYAYQSPVTPPSVFDYDVATGESTLLKRQEVLGGYDASRYVCERQWATARDGVRIPLSILRRKDFVQDGAAPLLLYGYGSYGLGMSASFSSNRFSLVDRGMPFVIAHIRGGDEMGEHWHDDGMLMKKKNTFFDFIDSAEYLIREKWTLSSRLAIQGGSAGGLLMGAVVNLRPDLFRAVHLAVPFVDVMNTMLDASLPLTVGEYLEWGNPNEKPAYDYMRSYSPYDNLEARAYPAMLVTTGINDSQVMYWEPAKYVARLRTLNRGSYPLLLKTNMGAGHGGASGRYDALKEIAFQYAWLMDQVGLQLLSGSANAT